jgi:phosphotransferase system enzyme I (PtsI)
VSSLSAAIAKSRQQLVKMQVKLERSLAGDSTSLIDAHLLILEDRMFVDRVIERIRTERINAEWAIQAVSGTILEAYDRVHDDYLRDRRGDLEDVVRRILFNLRSFNTLTFDSLRYNSILVGPTILPSTLLELKSPRLVGVVTETGGPLSHTAIIARSMKIPAVMGVADVLPGLMSGELIIVDGDEGVVICAPSEATMETYRARVKADEKSRKRQARVSSAPCVTRDRISILLGCNINYKDEIDAAVSTECEAIGLYRTEFDFYRDGRGLTEDELTGEYAYVLERARPRPVNIRAVDFGMKDGIDASPSSGARGMRFLLENRSLFRRQLRAILRASVHGYARILLPFVATLDELVEARQIINDVWRRLVSRGVDVDDAVTVGVMIETPSAAFTADLMASEADFLCLGTNDLIQYLLAVDRTDQTGQQAQSPFQPAVLRALKQVQSLVEPTGKPILVCGELAADPKMAAVLLGLGFTRLSVNVEAYPRIKRMIRSVAMTELRDLADGLLGMRSRDGIQKRVEEVLGEPA